VDSATRWLAALPGGVLGSLPASALVLTTFLFPLALQLALLSYLSGSLRRMMVAVMGFRFSMYFAAPGTVLHELSHMLACIFTRTGLGEIRLFSPHEEPPGSGRWVLGYVQHETPSALSSVLISLAPLFGCTVCLACLTRWLLPGLEPLSVPSQGLASGDLLRTLGAYGGAYLDSLGLFLRSLDWLDLRTWLLLYLLLALTPGAAPSGEDMRHFWRGFVYLAVSALLLVAFLIHAAASGAALMGMLLVLPALASANSYVGLSCVATAVGIVLLLPLHVLAGQRR